jgi:hypothetical protein
VRPHGTLLVTQEPVLRPGQRSASFIENRNLRQEHLHVKEGSWTSDILKEAVLDFLMLASQKVHLLDIKPGFRYPLRSADQQKSFPMLLNTSKALPSQIHILRTSD